MIRFINVSNVKNIKLQQKFSRNKMMVIHESSHAQIKCLFNKFLIDCKIMIKTPLLIQNSDLSKLSGYFLDIVGFLTEGHALR